MTLLKLTAALFVPALLSAQTGTTNVASTAPVVRRAESPPPAASKATATLASSSKTTATPVLDGKLDDPAWANAQSIDSFLEYDPNPGVESRFKTVVRVVHDD